MPYLSSLNLFIFTSFLEEIEPLKAACLPMKVLDLLELYLVAHLLVY
jgi:hypothetical protein